MALLPTFPKFDIHQDANAGPRWKKWLQIFERLLIAIVPDSETHPKVGKDPSPATDNRHALAVLATSVEEPTPMAESAQQKGKSAETAEKSDTLILYAGLQLSAPLNKMMSPMLTTSLPTSLIRRMSFTPQSYLPVR